MIKNKIAHLMLQTAYVTLGLIVIVASFGIFEIHEGIRTDFYIHFTNISNYFAVAVVFIQMILTIKAIKKGEEGYSNSVRTLKFIGLVCMTITFLIFNVVLAGQPNRHEIVIDGTKYIANLPIKDFRVGSILAHIVLPILYFVDWILFYEHRKDKWYTPLLTLVLPIAYIARVYIRAGIMLLMKVPMGENMMFPYGFLAFNNKLLPLILVGFFVGFTAIGYIWFGIDRLIKSKK